MVELERLVSELGGSLHAPAHPRAGAVDVTDVQLDSRFVGAGDLFAALPGRAADGARYAHEAVVRGAAAVLSPAPLPSSPGVPNWVHADARRIAGEAAAAVHGRPSHGMTVVAVTGTNGKTTTAHLAGQLFALVGRRVAVLGTTGHTLAGGVSLPATHTTPDAPQLQRLLRRHRELGGDTVVLELSSHALDQDRHAGLEITVGVFTNLTRDHLDYHGDMEGYAAAKQRLFAALGPDGCAVVNADDPSSGRMAAAATARGARVVTYSARSRADLWAHDIVLGPRGSNFILEGMGISSLEVTLSLVGRHNVANALAALAAVLSTGASPTHALGGLAALSPAPGRLERISAPDRGISVLVDYAHTPDALQAVLSSLREVLAAQGQGRLVCVFGCGGDRDPGKRAPMGAAVGRLADVAVVTSDNPRSEDPRAIAASVLAGLEGTPARVLLELDRRAAIAAALGLARTGDVVLIAGKGHESVQVVGGVARPFDDRAVARELLDPTGKEG